MNKQKKQKAEYLLSEIGGIDDRFLQETVEWRAGATVLQPRRRSIRMLLVAATLALSLMISLVCTVVLLLKQDEAPSPPPPSNTPVLDESQTLNALLQSCTESTSFTKRTFEEIDFFDGTVRLTLQDRETGAIYTSRPLTKAEQSTLTRDLSARKDRATEATSSAYLVWITLGNGDVISPYLAHTPGNMGAASLFDYEAEYVPTQEFNQLLEGLI